MDVLSRFVSVAPHLRLALDEGGNSKSVGETRELTNLANSHKDVIRRKATFVARHFIEHASKDPTSRGMLVLSSTNLSSSPSLALNGLL